MPRRTTGTCAMHQRQLTEAIKRARQIGPAALVTDSIGDDLERTSFLLVRSFCVSNKFDTLLEKCLHF